MILATTMAIYFVLQNWKTWVWATAGLAGAILLALIVHYLFFLLIKRFARRTSSVIDDSLVRHSEQPTRWIFPLIAILLALPLLPVRHEILAPLQHALGLGVIASVAWVVILLMDVFTDAISAKYAIDVVDNLAARQIQTQAQVLRRIFVVVVVLLTLGIMLMTFPAIRTLGTSLLASAGLAGLVLGMAMRPTLASLVAGIQIALTQPIRIEDVVIIEGEWGWIEEIRTTYVVVRIWDLRRLVVPLSYFIEKPFQNWTRVTANLLGTVFVYVDYSISTEEVRQELHRILESSGMWDGKVWGLQVTDAKEHTLELRALMSAPDGSKAWDLRCHVREKLIQFLQAHHPQSLPRTRAEVRLEKAS
ncbi:MAG TPA: mechanosensitive ion channel domain-containing protein [Terriglobales bacterium]